MVYVWNTVGFSADANKVGKELEDLEKQNGSINRYEVLEKAKNENTELHKCFEWDDSVAGEKYRLIQASNILTSISVKVTEKETTRYYVNVKTKENEKEYKNIKAVINNPDEYEQLISKARKDFENYKAKYEKVLKRETLKTLILEVLE